MTFSPNEFDDPQDFLEKHPEWRAELRRIVLTEDLLKLPQLVSELTKAQRTAADAQREAAEAVKALAGDGGVLKEMLIEDRFRDRAPGYFRRLVHRPHALTTEEWDELHDLLDDAIAAGRLTEAQTMQITQADLIVTGRDPHDATKVYLVIEVSWEVGVRSVEKARLRASLLEKAGVRAMPVVAGAWRSLDAEQMAKMVGIPIVVDPEVADFR